jgi:ribosome-binding protein aMBF1 (putative translation factor)
VVDWRRIINALARAGMDRAQQALELDVSPRTITNWREGVTEPKHRQGEKLLSLYRSVAREST